MDNFQIDKVARDLDETLKRNDACGEQSLKTLVLLAKLSQLSTSNVVTGAAAQNSWFLNLDGEQDSYKSFNPDRRIAERLIQPIPTSGELLDYTRYAGNLDKLCALTHAVEDGSELMRGVTFYLNLVGVAHDAKSRVLKQYTHPPARLVNNYYHGLLPTRVSRQRTYRALRDMRKSGNIRVIGASRDIERVADELYFNSDSNQISIDKFRKSALDKVKDLKKQLSKTTPRGKRARQWLSHTIMPKFIRLRLSRNSVFKSEATRLEHLKRVIKCQITPKIR